MILAGGLLCGPTTGVALDHWQILKLELMLSTVPSIEQVGLLLQWSADTTEHAHIKVVKDPASRTNNQNYDSQICCYLDRVEKCWQFDTAVALCAAELSTMNDEGFTDHLNLDSDLNLDLDLDLKASDNDIGADEDNKDILNGIWAPKHQSTNYFQVAVNTLLNTLLPPPHTFIALLSTAIHLNNKISIYAPVEVIAETFGLPDLWAALGDYLVCNGMSVQNFHSFGGRRRSSSNAHLPFKDL